MGLPAEPNFPKARLVAPAHAHLDVILGLAVAFRSRQAFHDSGEDKGDWSVGWIWPLSGFYGMVFGVGL